MRDAVEREFRAHRGLLWGLGYRMTGSAADADEIVQETFTRALEKPPDDRAPWRSWLVHVAANLARDRLRARKRTEYVGAWLPAPVELDKIESPDATPDARYGLLESATFAFLIALEELTPKARAVLLLRDVFDESVRETAVALGISEADVKTTLHRARAIMAAYDARRCVPSEELSAKSMLALQTFLGAVASGDVAQVEKMLADSVRAVSDGAGRYKAAINDVVGRDNVARLMLRLAPKGGAVTGFRLLTVNGLPAVLLERSAPETPRDAPRFLIRLELEPDGRVGAIHTVLAPEKLAAL